MRSRHNLAGWRGAQFAGRVLQHSAFDLPRTGDALLHQELVIVVECRAARSFVLIRIAHAGHADRRSHVCRLDEQFAGTELAHGSGIVDAMHKSTDFTRDDTSRLILPEMRPLLTSDDAVRPVNYPGIAVADLLGVKPKEPESPLSLAYSVAKGLPVSALEKLAARVCPHDVRSFSYRVVPKPTLERRRREKRPLTIEESDRLARIAKVFAFGLEVFRDEAKVRSFLERSHPMLDNKASLEVALATGPGADAVINILGRAA